MSEKVLKFPKQIYVGLRSEGEGVPPLGYATPYTFGADFIKRKENVDSWTRRKNWNRKDIISLDPLILDNDFIEGFKINDYVSRYTTSNKWFRVEDPRGFELEISAENLIDILVNGTVQNGSIHGAFMWARDGAVNFLCRQDHPSYIQSTKVIVANELTYGDVIRVQKSEATFIGIRYLYRFDIQDRTCDEHGNLVKPARRSYWNERKQYDVYSYDPTPWYIFECCGEPIAIRKPKKIAILERGKEVNLEKELVEGVPLRLVAGDTSLAVIFDNKEDMLKYRPTKTASQFYNELYKGYNYITKGLIELK